ncbi:MAG: glycosyltransferase family 4 protein [Bacteroidales bacterium]|nr:glycosyltransferase family 4 protein [Bacteroidales bacterium]
MDSTKYGGIERFNVELSRQLADKGFHSVFVYESMPVVQQFVEDLKSTGSEVLVIRSRHNVLGFCKSFWQLLRQYNFCLIHAHFTKARFYALPLALQYGIKNIVYTFHSTVPPLKQIKYHTRVWYKIFNKYCRIVAVSKDIEKVARQNWPNASIQNLYLGINSCKGNREQARRELHLSDDLLLVMCTANFNHIKGLDILVKAVAQLHQCNDLRNVVFYVVGQPDKDKVELQRMIDGLGLSPYMHLEGISNQIPVYLNAADIYVQPSRNEGLPLSLMEACSVELPIVASRIGGIPEVAVEGENAILFEVGNVNDCASALHKLIKDVSLRKRYGLKSRQIYEDKFQLSNNVSHLIEYYQLS